jgi:hypothetical protein
LTKPSLTTSLSPIYGSSLSAIHDFQNGNYFLGVLHTAIAASDWLLVGAAARFVGKSLFGVAAKESAEVVYTRVSEEGFEHFVAKGASGQPATFVTRTEGAVYGMALENAPLWRTLASGAANSTNKTIQWVGQAAYLLEASR